MAAVNRARKLQVVEELRALNPEVELFWILSNCNMCLILNWSGGGKRKSNGEDEGCDQERAKDNRFGEREKVEGFLIKTHRHKASLKTKVQRQVNHTFHLYPPQVLTRERERQIKVFKISRCVRVIFCGYPPLFMFLLEQEQARERARRLLKERRASFILRSVQNLGNCEAPP